ncbi:aminotransferase class I/II-fold pyridoxal phosphate-dependent enzyme [Spirillospora sp. CA-294931]|uniref:aminotransferase class I/II-fold pyridoxal phosphate-dependent enzyme n=1 Tax=Spirillospora sp. CA-294931 TaxID=3240042 RepID=UPI003D933B05
MNALIQYLQGCGTARDVSMGIERAIHEGHLRPGEALPTIRALAGQLGVNTATVANAYRQLQARGLTYGDRRRGTRVNGTPAAFGPPPGHTGGLIDLASGNVDPALLPDLGSALAHRYQGTTSYTAVTLLPRLHEVASGQFRADGIATGRLAAVSGALDGIERILNAHVNAGDRIALEEPCFSRTLDLVRSMNLTAEPVACDQEGPLPESLAQALRRGARGLIVTPRAQNPTGSALTAERAERIKDVLGEHPGTLLIEDDHAALVVDQPAITLTGGWTGPWAVIRSYAKALGPDLRVAVVTGDETTISRVEWRQRLGIGWVSHILQGAVADLLVQPPVQRLLDRARRVYSERRAFVIETLAEAGVTAHGRSGFNVWVPVRHESDTVLALREHGYAVLAGERFRLGGPPAIRVTTAALPTQDAARFTEALRSVLAATPGTGATT